MEIQWKLLPNQRVNLAVCALKLGSDYERICRLLSWAEFESIAARAFEANQYSVLKNLRFQQAGKRWELDVVGFSEPLIVCVDCKHWRRGWSRAAIIKIVEAQTERTRAFADALNKIQQDIQLGEWETAVVIPLILSLVPGPFKFHKKVPIVPVLQLRDFINNMPLEVDSLTYFRKKNLIHDQKLTRYST